MNLLSRRRFIAISASAAALPSSALAAPTASWHGVAMGASAQMQIAGLSQHEAGEIFERARAEVERLEQIFSLYRPDSVLVRLNAAGTLQDPPPEMLELLSTAALVNEATGGAFDPTIQPIWRLYADAAMNGRLPASRDLADARRLVGWDKVRLDEGAITLARPGMAMTLNGIAQGYLADRVAALLRREGLRNVLVDMGEIVAAGDRPGGGAWRAGIVAPDDQDPARIITLSDRALATSAPMGTTIGGTGAGHILDPRTGRPGGKWKVVSVSADRAALADGLSTAFCLMSRDDIQLALQRFADVRVEHIGMPMQG